MILGYDVSDIVELALNAQGSITDGCALYDYDNGKMVSGAYTTGTIENPANHLLEIYRISQGALNTDGFDCNDCPYEDEEFITRMKKEEPNLYTSKEECCRDAWFDIACENFYEDFDNNSRNSIEQEIRDIIENHIGEELSKLHEIHILCYERFYSPYHYQQEIFNDTYEMNILDNLVDEAMENGFKLIKPKKWLSGDIDMEHNHWDAIADYDENLSNDERKLLYNISMKLLKEDLDGALKLLRSK